MRLPVVLAHDFGAGKIHWLGGPAVVLFDFIVMIAAFLGIAVATRCVTGAGSEGNRFSLRKPPSLSGVKTCSRSTSRGVAACTPAEAPIERDTQIEWGSATKGVGDDANVNGIKPTGSSAVRAVAAR